MLKTGMDATTPSIAPPSAPQDTRLIDDPQKLQMALAPIKQQLLQALREPGSAASLAAQLDLPRQRLGYHLRALEEAGLVRLVEERRRRGFTERILVADAQSFVVDPGLLDRQQKSIQTQDRFAAQHLINMAGQIVRDLTRMQSAAGQAGQRLLSFSIEAEVGFAKPGEFEDFARELAEALAQLARKYPKSPRRRAYRVAIGALPAAAKASAPPQPKVSS